MKSLRRFGRLLPFAPAIPVLALLLVFAAIPGTAALAAANAKPNIAHHPAGGIRTPGTPFNTSPGAAAGGPIDSLNLSTPNQPKETGAIDPKDIPEVVLDEMKEVVSNCQENKFYASFHDCKCIGIKFLDARLKSDPKTPKERIFDQVANDCPDEASIAGYVYTSCAGYMNTVRKDYVSFCTCSANDVARSYAKAPRMNLDYIDGLRKNAMIKCGIGPLPGYQSPYDDN